eukprot:scaffold78742_cov56-Phaeocystis_antarctica.AAC.2
MPARARKCRMLRIKLREGRWYYVSVHLARFAFVLGRTRSCIDANCMCECDTAPHGPADARPATARGARNTGSGASITPGACLGTLAKPTLKELCLQTQFLQGGENIMGPSLSAWLGDLGTQFGL